MGLSLENQAIMQKMLLFLSESKFTVDQLITLCIIYDYFDGNNISLINNIRNINITAYYKSRISKLVIILYNFSLVIFEGDKLCINPVTLRQLENNNVSKQKLKTHKVCEYLNRETFAKINKKIKEFENENKQNIFIK